MAFIPAAVYSLFETIFAIFKVIVTWKEKELIGGKFVLCYSDAGNPVSHPLCTSYVHFHSLEHIKSKNR